MAKEKILITVKTYPTLSRKYGELVCTAGFREDGSWVRIYPVPFRKLDFDKQYPKYNWIEADLVRNTKDFRPESFKPRMLESIKPLENLPPDGDAWINRRKICLKNVKHNLTNLINEAKNKSICTSLAVFKPKNIHDFVWEPSSEAWDKTKLAALEAKAAQGDLFETGNQHLFNVVKKLPWKFSYIFSDEAGKKSKLMIEDWETGQLYWNCLKNYNDSATALNKVREKYLDNFARTKDLYFFLGTTQLRHYTAKNPFIIVGTFHPKHITKPGLFE